MQRISGTVVKTGALALALALAGCGGGSSTSAPEVPVAQRAVQGTAAKGLIKGAKVNVHAIDAAGVRAAAVLASATTGADGRYQLQVPLSVRNFVIEVSAAPGAVMADEASGTDLPFPDGLKLRNVVTLAESAAGAYEGTVSPLTEMVARTAQTPDGKLPPQAVAQAKASVRTLLGFDPETVKPVNSNSAAAASASEDEKNQSLALAAISKMASTASADCAQSNAGERMSCVVGQLAGSVVVKDGQPGLDPARLAQFRDAIAAVAQDKTINRTGKDRVVGIPVLLPPPVSPPVTPPPTGTAPTPLQATRALFGSLRTNLRAIDEGDAFRATADSVKADLDGAIAPFGNNVSGFAALAMDALDRLDRYRNGDIAQVNFTVANNQMMDAWPARTSVSFLRGDGKCEIEQSSLSILCTVVQEAFLPNAAPNTIVYATRSFRLQPKPGSTQDFTYTAFLQKRVIGHSGFVSVGAPVCHPLGATFSGAMRFARSGATLTQFAINGRMPGRTERGVFLSDAEDWSLDVARTEEADGVALYQFGGSVSAITGQDARKVEIDGASFLRVALGTNNKVLPNAANELQLTVRGIVGSTTVGGTLRVRDGKQDKSGTTHVPASVSFEGSLEHHDATVFSGHVALARNGYEQFDATAALSETNFVADSIEIGGALSVPNRPTLSLTLGATRTGLDTGTISAQYRDGSAVINASVTARSGERHPLVKVSSADGVAFSFTNSTVPVEVTKDGAVTALLDLGKGLIHYSDGSTESLK